MPMSRELSRSCRYPRRMPLLDEHVPPRGHASSSSTFERAAAILDACRRPPPCTSSEATDWPSRPENAEVLLAVEIALEAVTHRLVEQDAGPARSRAPPSSRPAGASTASSFAEGLAHRLAGEALPAVRARGKKSRGRPARRRRSCRSRAWPSVLAITVTLSRVSGRTSPDRSSPTGSAVRTHHVLAAEGVAMTSRPRSPKRARPPPPSEPSSSSLRSDVWPGWAAPASGIEIVRGAAAGKLTATTADAPTRDPRSARACLRRLPSGQAGRPESSKCGRSRCSRSPDWARSPRPLAHVGGTPSWPDALLRDQLSLIRYSRKEVRVVHAPGQKVDQRRSTDGALPGPNLSTKTVRMRQHFGLRGAARRNISPRPGELFTFVTPDGARGFSRQRSMNSRIQVLPRAS